MTWYNLKDVRISCTKFSSAKELQNNFLLKGLNVIITAYCALPDEYDMMDNTGVAPRTRYLVKIMEYFKE